MSETETLLSAMLAVQAEAPKLIKDKRNPAFKDATYISLKSLTEQVTPTLHKHNLLWSTRPTTTDRGEPALRYRLTHVPTDESLEDVMLLLLDKANAPGHGSAITYARRQCLCAVLNLVADDDDDGNAASSSAPAGRVAQSGSPSEKQLDYLKSLIGRHKPPEATLRALLRSVEADGVDPTVDGWSKALNRAQVSQMIEAFKSGVLPTGESDIPDDLEPAAVAAGDESDLPWGDES